MAPPRKKVKNFLIRSIEEMTENVDPNDDAIFFQHSKGLFSQQQSLKVWKDMYERFIRSDNIRQRLHHFYYLIPHDTSFVSPEWINCFRQELEKLLFVSFNEWRISLDDPISILFEEHASIEKTEHDSCYRTLFHSFDPAILIKAITKYVKVSSRSAEAKFYLLRYTVTLKPDADALSRIMDFVYNNQCLTKSEQLKLKKKLIFQVFVPIVKSMIADGNALWRAVYYSFIRVMVEVCFEDRKSHNEVFCQFVHFFKVISSGHDWPCEGLNFTNIVSLYNMLHDWAVDLGMRIFNFDPLNPDNDTHDEPRPSEAKKKAPDSDEDTEESDAAEDIDSDEDDSSEPCPRVDKEYDIFIFVAHQLYSVAWINFIAEDDCPVMLLREDNFHDRATIPPESSPAQQEKKPKINLFTKEEDKLIVNFKAKGVSHKLSALNVMLKTKNLLKFYYPQEFQDFISSVGIETTLPFKLMQINYFLIENQQDEIAKICFDEQVFSQAKHNYEFLLHRADAFIRAKQFQKAKLLIICLLWDLKKSYDQLPSNRSESEVELEPNRYDPTIIKLLPLSVENIAGMALEHLTVALFELYRIDDVPLHNNVLTQLIVLSQRRFPRYTAVLKRCFRVIAANRSFHYPDFDRFIFQRSVLFEFRDLKFSSPQIEFYFDEECRAPVSDLNSIIDKQLSSPKSDLFLSWEFFLDFFYHSFKSAK